VRAPSRSTDEPTTDDRATQAEAIKATPDSTKDEADPTASAKAPGSATTIDLRRLESSGVLSDYETKEVRVRNDPAYHSPKRFRGIPLLKILRDHLPVQSIDWRRNRILFVAADGYKTSVSWEDLQAGQAYLAIEDLDAKDEKWSMITRGKDTVTPAPFYLVWEDVDYDPEHQAWPYQLTTIRPITLESLYGTAFPTHDRSQEEGFRLFQIHCSGCHSVNLIGGSVGPELNVPMNVSEYWRAEALRPFIRHARSFRARTTMPDFRKLAAEEIDAIVNYIVSMKDAKTCSSVAACDALLSDR
jgi:mono/diheme cytochrome c family protein